MLWSYYSRLKHNDDGKYLFLALVVHKGVVSHPVAHHYNGGNVYTLRRSDQKE
jgi:hypothetical protein